MQAQLQALIETVIVRVDAAAVEIFQPNKGSNVEVAKLQTFNGKVGIFLGFLMAYRLYIGIRIRKVVVEEQIQWILSYVQRWLVDIWKENILKDLEIGTLEYVMIEKFLMYLIKEFSRRDNEIIRMAELKKVEQES